MLQSLIINYNQWQNLFSKNVLARGQEKIISHSLATQPLKSPFIQSAEPYVDDINKDFNLDIDSENGAQQLMAMLIIKLALKCPDNFKELSKNLK